MNGPIEEEYFNWLCAKVLDPGSRIYIFLLQILQGTEFVWLVPGDKSREDDGLELRLEFMTETRSEPDTSWETTGCSVFEMLYALSRRAEFQTNMPAQQWFWKMIENLRLDDYRHVCDDDIPFIEESLYKFVWRQYDPNGHGGLFPMRFAERDLTEVEIWYQLNWFIEEQHLT